MSAQHRVVIIGGGFGGLYAARHLKNAPVEVTLIDKRNFHLFQPLLYQVATGGLSPGDISSPLRAVLKRQSNASVILDEAVEIDSSDHRVVLRSGKDVPYDSLIVSTGASHSYFGNTEWERYAPGLKTVEEATDIRSRILVAFEQAESESDPERQKRLMTFVIVGAGPTGVEMAGAIGELAHATLKNDFEHINPSDATIYLLEGMDRVLPPYPERLSAKAQRVLETLGVTVRTGAMVTDVRQDGVSYRQNDRIETIDTTNIFWAAGVRASPLGQNIAEATGTELDTVGRVKVSRYCTVVEDDRIFVIGDLSRFETSSGDILPGVAPVAIHQGRYVARVIQDRLNENAVKEFSYWDRGNLAVIGRNEAVADIRRFRFSGYIAWLLWLFIHLMYLVGFENRVLVFIQWGIDYFTRNRGARLITGKSKDLPSIRYWEHDDYQPNPVNRT
jgi:NADH dehydrogenase